MLACAIAFDWAPDAFLEAQIAHSDPWELAAEQLLLIGVVALLYLAVFLFWSVLHHGVRDHPLDASLWRSHLAFADVADWRKSAQQCA